MIIVVAAVCEWACWWSMFGRTKFGCFLGRDVGVCGNVPSQM